MKNKIVVVGSSNIDLIMKMDRLPEKGETVTDAEFMQTYGGKGANQAVAAARAGGNIQFITAVGNDAHTPGMLKSYRDDGIDTRFIFNETDIASGHALIMIGHEGDNYLSVAPGANYRLTPNRIGQVDEAFEDAAMIVMQYEIPEATIKRVLDLTEERDIPVLMNFAPARNFDSSYLGKVSILVVNEVEAEYLSGQQVETDEDIESAASVLRQKGIDSVIISLGKRGAFAQHQDQKIRIPAYPVEAVDTTSAGDVFCGTLAVAMVEDMTPAEALRFANAAAALCVTKMGAQPSAPTRQQIESLLQQESKES